MNTVWVVDDEDNIRSLIGRYLAAEGYESRLFSSAEALNSALVNDKPDLLILDIMLPGEDGLSLCRNVRDNYAIPVIFVSARGEEFDRILGLELGADDYLAKPFSPRELMVRVKNLLKRARQDSEPVNRLIRKNLVIIPEQRKIIINGIETSFTAREFDLLFLLAREANRSFSRQRIIDAVWGYDFDGDVRAVDDTIKRIRRKLREKDSRPEIATVRGYGYRLDV